MNKLTQAKIIFAIKQHNYTEINHLLDNSKEANQFVFEYITSKFNKKKDSIGGCCLRRILCAMSDEYAVATIDYLIDKVGVSSSYLDLMLKCERLNVAIANKKRKYLNYFIDNSDFMHIIMLYNHENITAEDMLYIKSSLYSKIINTKKAYELAMAQQISGIDIVQNSDIEKAILNSDNAKYIYKLMALKNFDKKKLIYKLSDIKHSDFSNRKYFLMALVEYFPEEVSKLPFGVLIEEIMAAGLSKEKNAELIAKVGNSIALMRIEKKENITYFDSEKDLGKISRQYKELK